MDWTPPENLDLQTILNEAKDDGLAGRYELALSKHIWFHRNALRLQPSIYGVRLTFGIAYWKTLTEHYPPALTALLEVRNSAEKSIRSYLVSGDTLRDAFHEFEAINKLFDETARTCDLFTWLDEFQPDVARQLYRIAQSALIRNRDWKMCGKFIDPKAMYEWSLKRYRNKKDLAEDPKYGINMRAFGEKCFANEIAILVALLYLNGRDEESEQLAMDALKEFENEDFASLLKESLTGVVATPWP
ncbi:MAG: hypothetical protein WCT04_02180 [Planctomycetota bacterium]